MLSIYFGELKEAVYNPKEFFDNTYLDSWLEDEFAAEVIKQIERGTILSPQAINTFALGVIPVTKISGGTKILLLVKNRPDTIFNASGCGDNCAKYFLKIGKEQDVTINLYHIMDFGKHSFKIRIANNNLIVHNMAELVEHAVLLV